VGKPWGGKDPRLPVWACRKVLTAQVEGHKRQVKYSVPAKDRAPFWINVPEVVNAPTSATGRGGGQPLPSVSSGSPFPIQITSSAVGHGKAPSPRNSTQNPANYLAA